MSAERGLTRFAIPDGGTRFAIPDGGARFAIADGASPLDAAKIERAYDAPPFWYDVRGFFILTFAYRSGLLSQLSFFSERMGANHLEVAVGTGTLLELVLAFRRLRKGPLPERVTGIDLAPAMLEGARRRFAKRDGVHLSVADAARMPFADATFDSVNLANAAHCMPDLDGTLSEIRRVLVPSGTLSLNVLLPPRGSALARHIAWSIDRWGMKKGLLCAPVPADEALLRIRTAGFHVETTRIHGNVLDVVARRESAPPC